MRYNGYPAAEINGGPRPDSAPARLKRHREIVTNSLPRGMGSNGRT